MSEGGEQAGYLSPLERVTPFWRNAVLLVLGVLVLWFFWSVRGVLNPLIIGYLLAFIAAPSVRMVRQRGLSHNAAVLVIFVVAGLAALVLASGLAYQCWHLTGEVLGDDGSEDGFVARIERTLADGLGWAEDMADELDLVASSGSEDPGSERGSAPGSSGQGPEVSGGPDEQTLEGAAPDSTAGSARAEGSGGAPGHRPGMLATLVGQVREWVTSEEAVGAAGEAGLRWTAAVVQFLGRGVGSLFGLATLLLLLPVYTYFLLFQLDNIHGFVRRYLPHRDRDRITRVGSQIGEVISNFFRGRLVVSLIKGLLIAAGLTVLGVPYALLFGLLGGFLSLVPFVGPLLAFSAAFLIGLTEFTLFASLWRVALVFGVAEVIEGYVLIPKILGETLGLHPIVVLASVMIGGAALGLFGMLLALPLTACVLILAREFVMPAVAEWADEGNAS